MSHPPFPQWQRTSSSSPAPPPTLPPPPPPSLYAWDLDPNNQSLASGCLGYFGWLSLYKYKWHTYASSNILREIVKAVIWLRLRACTKSGRPRWNRIWKAVTLSTAWGWLSLKDLTCCKARNAESSRPWIMNQLLNSKPIPSHISPTRAVFGEGKRVSFREETSQKRKKQKVSVYSGSEFRPIAAAHSRCIATVRTCTIFGHCDWTCFSQWQPISLLLSINKALLKILHFFFLYSQWPATTTPDVYN